MIYILEFLFFSFFPCLYLYAIFKLRRLQAKTQAGSPNQNPQSSVLVEPPGPSFLQTAGIVLSTARRHMLLHTRAA